MFLDRKRLRDRRKQVIACVSGVLAVMAKFPETRGDLESWLDRNHIGGDCEYAAVARAVCHDQVAFGL